MDSGDRRVQSGNSRGGRVGRHCNAARTIDSTVLLAFLAIFALIYFYAQPLVKRGFFCNDESLAHPLKANTVPTSVLLSVGILGPIFLILIIDLAVIKKSRGETGQTIQNFTFGFFVNLLFTEMTKYTIGRLRPNFFAMCNLDWSTVDCGNQTHPLFVTDYTCPGLNNNTFQAKNAHMSFVSGHSSIAACSAAFVIFFLQSRFLLLGQSHPRRQSWKGARYLLPMAQLAAASAAVFTALTRISDYWHHPGDVVAGFILGVATMYWNCAYIMGLFSTSSNHQRNKVSDSYFAVRTYSTGSQTSSLDSLDDPDVSNEPRVP